MSVATQWRSFMIAATTGSTSLVGYFKSEIYHYVLYLFILSSKIRQLSRQKLGDGALLIPYLPPVDGSVLLLGYWIGVHQQQVTSSLYATPACHETKDIVRAAISIGDLVPTVTMMIL